MKAVRYSETGTSDVLEVVDRADPLPGEGDVRVRVHVSGVNPTDWKARAGDRPGTRVNPAQVPNQDGAGMVDQVGPGVHGLSVGDRVWLWDAAFQRPEGTAQGLVVIPERQAVRLADDVSFDVGASVGIPALTAHRALSAAEFAPLQLAPGSLDGRTVLVAGGAGSVGHAAIQLAVWAGATVITTVSSSDKAERAQRAGAHHVVNYREEDAAARIRQLAPTGVNIVVEVNPAANMKLNEQVTAPDATISIYADSPATLEVPVRPSMVKNLRFQFILTYTTVADVKDAAVRAVSAAMTDHALEVGDAAGLAILRFPLEATAEAHDAVEKGFVGHVLIDVP